MLKDKIIINHLELRNRLVMPPMATGMTPMRISSGRFSHIMRPRS